MDVGATLYRLGELETMNRWVSSLDFGFFGARLPIVLQSEAAECGLACIAMVVSYHGQSTDMADLRRRFGMSLRGATLKDLNRIASALGTVPRPLRLELEELSHLKAPCILHWDLNHFVVLKEVTKSGVVIHDPAAGVRSLSMAEVSKHFTGVALELAPASGLTSTVAPPTVKLRSLIGNMMGVKGALARIFSVAMGIEVFAALTPLYMQWVLDDALVTADRDLLTTLALGFSLLLIFKVTFAALRGWMLLAVGADVKVQGRANLFSHLVELPASFFETRQMGDILSRFGSQETILQAITTDVVEAILDGILAVITLGLMFTFAPTLALVVIAGAMLYVLLRWASYTPLRRAQAESINWAARRDTHFLETLRGMKTVKLFNAQEERRRGWLNYLVETINRTLTTQKLQVVFNTANQALVGGISLLIVWLGARRVLDHTFTVGALVAFIAYKDQFMQRITALINKGLDIQMLRIHGERLADIALTAPEGRDHGEAFESSNGEPAIPRKISLKNVRYRYSEHDPWVLDGINIEIEPGESVAIVGSSGCGKTTLLKLMASLLRPTEGQLLVENQAIAQMGMTRYRSMLGVVMQDDHLFAGSIADNISFFAENADQARIEQCAQMAAVHDVIAAMPMGYATLIGDMGAALSGGQKQRVLIARALYRNPSILLMDEATSHLDVARERAVNEAMRKSSLTRVIVAHRPETILSADRVIMLADGKVVNEVRKGELAAKLAAEAAARGGKRVEALPKVIVRPLSAGKVKLGTPSLEDGDPNHRPSKPAELAAPSAT
jgi:ATP-binding cassette subfamily B protein RaxB